MVPPGPASNSLAASTLPVDGFFNALSQEQVSVLARNSLILPTRSWYNSINKVPQSHLVTSAISSQLVSRPVQPFFSGKITPESQILRSGRVSDESFGQYSLNTIPQLVAKLGYPSFNTAQEHEPAETSCQVANESIAELHGSSSVSSAMVPHPSSRITQSPGLNLLAEVGEEQRQQYEDTIGNMETIEENVEFEPEPEQGRLRIVEFFENVESTGQLEISLDVLNNDALLKKLKESSISIHTVEIQSTCEVHQVLRKKVFLPSCLKVLRIRENILNFEDVTDLIRCLNTASNLHELDLFRTKFKESSFLTFISAFHYCRDLASLVLTDNSLTEQEINGLITLLESIKNLKILNLSKCILTETQANAILHKREQAKNIVTLDLSQNAIQGHEIVVGICQMQSLEELDLSHNCIRFYPLPNLEGKRNHLSTCLKAISLSFNYMKPDDISRFCSLIRSGLSKLCLDFNHVGPSIWSLCSLGERISHLKVLNLANTDICDNVDGLASLLSLVKELEDLNLSSNNSLAADFQQLQAPLSKLTQLKILNLSMNAIGPDGMKELADIFKKFPLLERLDMNSSYITEEEINVLCKSLVSLRKLKYLNLSGNRIDIDIEVLDDALVLPATLEELLFSRIIYGEKLFDREMRRLKNLRKLHLNKLILRECDVEALVITLSCFPKLEELSLAGVFALECETILTAIKSLKNIRKIDLTGIKLSNEQALVDMLSSLSSLEELVLDAMSGTNVDYKSLFKVIKFLKCLRKLSFRELKVTDNAKLIFDTLSSVPKLEDVVLPQVSLRYAKCITENFSSLESLVYMRKLDLRGIIFENCNAQALARVLPSLQLLETLKLKLEIDSDESSKQLFAALRTLKYLKELVLISEGEISGNGLAEVLRSLQLLENVKLHFFTSDNKRLLRALGNLRYVKKFSSVLRVEDSSTEAFVHMLSSLPLLEKLDFSTDYLLNDEFVEQLYGTLGKLKYLRKLYLFIFNINWEAEALAEVLPSLELLEELNLHPLDHDTLDSEHVKKVFVAISKLRYLKKLVLNCQGIGCADLKALNEMLPSLPMLKKLVLLEIYSVNQSQSKGLFIALFGKVKHLRKLYLNWKRITQSNVDALVEGLASLQMLEELVLSVSCYSCTHDCDDDCDDECDHDCKDDCSHECDDTCNDECDHVRKGDSYHHCCDDTCDVECGHDYYDDSCHKCRHDNHEREKNYLQTKVLTAAKK